MPQGNQGPKANHGSTPREDQIAALVKRRNASNAVAGGIMFAAAASSVAITCGIVAMLTLESLPFFREVNLWDFLTDTMWAPLFAAPRYGILPLIAGTFVTTLVALAIALPIGTIIAVYLSEFAPHTVREVIKPATELLSAVPTIVFGYFALQVVTPALQTFIPDLPTFNMLSAGIVMGIMIIPYVSSLSEDALRAVPMLLREGSYGMGASRMQTAFKVVIPSAISGLAAAYILGISRAIGETMIVAVAAGMQPNLTLDPRQPAETITAYIVQVSLGDVEHGTVAFHSIFAAGATLFVLTLGLNVFGHYLRKRYRKAY
ncbi:MAG: phosphate ABC transporter permease subunit PstC [Planctomycetes bacterium]|nr:phosphate ABC transporter permease subunit PstC [Planctomycetota bacterium]